MIEVGNLRPTDSGVSTGAGPDNWRGRALCAGLDPREADRMFFGGKRHRPTQSDLREVREFCDGCPVQWECLEFALSVPTMHDRVGVFAGLLPAERATLRESGQPRDDVWIGGDPTTRASHRHHAQAS